MKMLHTVVPFLLLAAQGAAAQTSPSEPLAVVQGLFDAMRAQDTAAMRATMHPTARLLTTGTNQEGQPVARMVAIDGWLRGIANARSRPDERLFDSEVRTDQDMATVWTRYEFYAGENFSHCGYDSFHLVRTDGVWKIVQVADTQQRSAERCGRTGAGTAPPRATPADTAAIVQALQRVFDGMLSRDTAALTSAFLPDATLIGLGSGPVTPAPASTWAQSLAGGANSPAIRERMVRPEVRVSDNLATVWTWYDLHVGDRFSHCGIDAAQLARTASGWKVAQIVYTMRRTPCDAPTGS